MRSLDESPSKRLPVKSNLMNDEESARTLQPQIPPKLVFTSISLTVDGQNDGISNDEIDRERNSKLKKALSFNVTLRSPALLQPSSYMVDNSSSMPYVNKPKGRPSLSRSDAMDECKRPHRIQSFISKHFGKNLPKTRRPLGMSLSCELQENQTSSRESWRTDNIGRRFIFSVPHPQLESICLHCSVAVLYREKFLMTEFENISRMWQENVYKDKKRTPFLGCPWSCENSTKNFRDSRTISDASNAESMSSGWSSTYSSVEISPEGTVDSPKKIAIICEQNTFKPSPRVDGNLKRRNTFHSLYTLKEIEVPQTERYLSITLPVVQNEQYSDGYDGSFSERSSDETYEADEINDHLPDQYRRSTQADIVSDLFRRALAKSPVAKKAALSQHESTTVCKHRTVEYWCDPKIRADEHIWLPSSGPSSSRDTECYVGERDCRKVGDKQSCAACHIVAHTACIPLLQQLHMKCKQTFYEESSMKKHLQRDDTYLGRHHWVHKWKHEGRCLRCGKSFQQKIFREKEVIAITCSWCKRSYHNRVGCFSSQCFEEMCDRGDLKEVIVPPSWIMFSQAIRKRTRKEHGRRRKRRMFLVRSTSDNIQYPNEPLLVFVNPKSGGNKGFKLLNTLCWLLNPRQVFDINTMQGPRFGLEMFRKVSTNLRLLVCGGDGTVGWVLSILDKINWPQYPPIGIVPLGTGNDLARCLGWGGSFSEEPMAHLLQSIIHETSVTHLDRWSICVSPNIQTLDTYNDEIDQAAQSELPLTVMNNYFSIGADAHVALQFHHSRSANPQMLNSRLKNRIAYGGLGTIDLFKRAWKSLHEYITLECDGMDLTAKIKEFKFHCVLFHNITYYAGGTVPWGTDCDESCRPSSCDGKIEVLGFTTASLAALQMGGKGERIAQCSEARIATTKSIPMQVDGEPCLLAPSIIEITFHSQVPMLRREKKLSYTPGALRKNPKLIKQPALNQAPSSPVNIRLPVLIVALNDYRTYRDHLERLKATASEVGVISIEAEEELEGVRQKIMVLMRENADLRAEGDSEWRFLDYVSSAEEGVFRVSKHQEQLTTLSDICSTDECIIILDEVPRKAPPLKPAKSFERSEIYEENGINDDTVQIVFRSDTQETHL